MPRQKYNKLNDPLLKSIKIRVAYGKKVNNAVLKIISKKETKKLFLNLVNASLKYLNVNFIFTSKK